MLSCTVAVAVETSASFVCFSLIRSMSDAVSVVVAAAVARGDRFPAALSSMSSELRPMTCTSTDNSFAGAGTAEFSTGNLAGSGVEVAEEVAALLDLVSCSSHSAAWSNKDTEDLADQLCVLCGGFCC